MTEVNTDIEMAVRLQFHDQGVTNENHISKYINELRENNYDLNVLNNYVPDKIIFSEDDFKISYENLDKYNNLDTISVINNLNSVDNNLNSNLTSSFNFNLNNFNQINFTNSSNSTNSLIQSFMNVLLNPQSQEDVVLSLTDQAINELQEFTLEEFKEKFKKENKEIDPKCSICQCAFDEIISDDEFETDNSDENSIQDNEDSDDEVIDNDSDNEENDSDVDSDDDYYSDDSDNYESDDEKNKDNNKIKIILLPCKHYFHSNCIKEWLKNYNYKCPICQNPCGEHQNNSQV